MVGEKRLPEHVVIVPDGNRRYAVAKGKKPCEGHIVGRDTFKKVLEWCKEFKIKELTFWAASSDNLKRSEEEVDQLMKLFHKGCDDFIKEYSSKKQPVDKVKVSFIGTLEKLPQDLQDKMMRVEELTKDNNDYKLNLLVGYDGHWELTRAAKKIAKKIEDGVLKSEDITPEVFEEHLALKSVPELIIRTGQIRLSGLLPWQSSYSELYFLPDLYWPDFTKKHFSDALEFFAGVERKFGK